MEVARGVQHQFADQLSGVALDDPDVEVVDEQGDLGAGEASAKSDVVQVAVVAQGHRAALVDPVVPDSAVWLDVGAGGRWLWGGPCRPPTGSCERWPGGVGPRCSRSGTG